MKTHIVIDSVYSKDEIVFVGTAKECRDWVVGQGFGYEVLPMTTEELKTYNPKTIIKQKKFNDNNELVDYDLELTEHDISKYDVLFHGTPKENKDSILAEGLKLDMPCNKSMIPSGLLFFSYPIDYNTSDLFRYYDDWCIIVLDVNKLIENQITFYDDEFSKHDRSSQNNHLCSIKAIPADCIKKVVEFDED